MCWVRSVKIVKSLWRGGRSRKRFDLDMEGGCWRHIPSTYGGSECEKSSVRSVVCPGVVFLRNLNFGHLRPPGPSR